MIDYIPRSLRMAALGVGLALTLSGCTRELSTEDDFLSVDSSSDINKIDRILTDLGYDEGSTDQDSSQDAGIDSKGCLEKELYYKDHDGDGKGDDNVSPKSLCEPEGEFKVLIGGDCNDNKNTIYAGAEEICDGFDNECKIPQVADEPLLNVPCDNYGTTKNGLGISKCDLGSKEYKLDSCDDPDICKIGDTKTQGTYKLFDKTKKTCVDTPLELICKTGDKEWKGKTVQAAQWFENKKAGSIEGTTQDGYDNDCNGIVDDGADLMASIPAGWFERGCDSVKNFSCESNAPIKMHELSAYLIDKFEVTNAAYAVCVTAGKCTSPKKLSSNKEADYHGNPKYGNFPVVNITWQQAVDYCTFAGKKLPTEAQWEKANGDDGRNYAWGGQSPDHKHPDPNCKDNLVNWNYNTCALSPESGTLDVTSFPKGKSKFGVFNLAGNVREWLADWFATDSYTTGPVKDGTGSANGTERCIHGGGWDTDKYGRDNLSRFKRNKQKPDFFNHATGSRCAK